MLSRGKDESIVITTKSPYSTPRIIYIDRSSLLPLYQPNLSSHLTMAVESDSGALTFAKTFVERMFAVKTSHEFAYELCKDMTVVSASYTPKPRVVSRLTVTRVMCNPVGTLHGGAISTLFDVCTTVALATARRWEGFGVTRTLSTTYLVAVFPGDEIEIEGEVLQMGKKMGE